MPKPHSGTDLELPVLQVIADGKSHSISGVYIAIERTGILNDSDYSKVPTTAGYNSLKCLKIEVPKGVDAERRLTDLVERHDLPYEFRYLNRVRYARRQLLKKGEIDSREHGSIAITEAGKSRLFRAQP